MHRRAYAPTGRDLPRSAAGRPAPEHGRRAAVTATLQPGAREARRRRRRAPLQSGSTSLESKSVVAPRLRSHPSRPFVPESAPRALSSLVLGRRSALPAEKKKLRPRCSLGIREVPLLSGRRHIPNPAYVHARLTLYIAYCAHRRSFLLPGVPHFIVLGRCHSRHASD